MDPQPGQMESGGETTGDAIREEGVDMQRGGQLRPLPWEMSKYLFRSKTSSSRGIIIFSSLAGVFQSEQYP